MISLCFLYVSTKSISMVEGESFWLQASIFSCLHTLRLIHDSSGQIDALILNPIEYCRSMEFVAWKKLFSGCRKAPPAEICRGICCVLQRKSKVRARKLSEWYYRAVWVQSFSFKLTLLYCRRGVAGQKFNYWGILTSFKNFSQAWLVTAQFKRQTF